MCGQQLQQLTRWVAGEQPREAVPEVEADGADAVLGEGRHLQHRLHQAQALLPCATPNFRNQCAACWEPD